jgi:hypothetical protein
MDNCCIFLVFHAYIKEMPVQEGKSLVNNLVRQRCAEGFNSGVKGLSRGTDTVFRAVGCLTL